MSLNKYKVLLSIGLGFSLAFVSTLSLFGSFLDSTEPSLLAKIILWNITATIYLIESGWLPSCQDCEMVVLLYIMFYSFIIGFIGYTIAILCGISTIKKLRK